MYYGQWMMMVKLFKFEANISGLDLMYIYSILYQMTITYVNGDSIIIPTDREDHV